jgi:hypothetical protein
MRIASRCASVLTAFALCACGTSATSDDSRDRNRPPTYGDTCGSNEECDEPFQCLDGPDGGSVPQLCTRPCSSDSDCPTWTATGHCAGIRRSACLGGVCDYPRCK